MQTNTGTDYLDSRVLRHTMAKAALLIAAGLFLLTGCSMTTMQVPDTLGAEMQTLPIERPKFTSDFGSQDYKFGSFVAQDVDTDGKRRKSVSGGGFSSSKSSQWFTFTLVSDAGARAATCEIKQSTKGVAGFGRTTGSMTCSFAAAEGDEWRLEIGPQAKEGKSMGKLTVAGIELLVTPNHQTGEGRHHSTPTGFNFSGAEGDLGAVDVFNQGIVYLKGDLSADLAAGISSAAISMLIFTNKTE
jgi:hypothetical protein